MDVVHQGFELIADYAQIPIRFTTDSRVRLEALRESSGSTIETDSMLPREKNYDDYEPERPATIPVRFDTRNWVTITVVEGTELCGGAIIARDTPGVEMLRDRSDIAVLWDIRVQSEWRGRGVGRMLFSAIENWARAHGCTQLIAETQDINVAACLFYQAMGCTLKSIDHEAYPAELDEVQIIWRKFV